MIRPPAETSWRRWWALVRRPGMSLLRILEHERLGKVTLPGLTLDVGGGEGTSYHSLLSVQGTLHWVNLDPALRPTYVADLNQGIPTAAGLYDNIISFNTLEHLWRDVFVLEEMHRVLKPGGTLYLSVPFLYRVHASPSDYHRHTAFFWEEALVKTGFRREDVRIEPLTFGALAASLSLMDFSVPWLFRGGFRGVVLFLSMLKARLRPNNPYGDGSDMPLGYFIEARKSS